MLTSKFKVLCADMRTRRKVDKSQYEGRCQKEDEKTANTGSLVLKPTTFEEYII